VETCKYRTSIDIKPIDVTYVIRMQFYIIFYGSSNTDVERYDNGRTVMK